MARDRLEHGTQRRRDGMQKVIAAHGPQSIGTLASPTSTVEEFYLLQKLVRALGSGNVDHVCASATSAMTRTRRSSPISVWPIANWNAGRRAADQFQHPQGSTAARPALRKAFLRGANLFAVNPVDYDFNFDSSKVILDPAAIPPPHRGVLAESTGASLPSRSRYLPAASQRCRSAPSPWA